MEEDDEVFASQTPGGGVTLEADKVNAPGSQGGVEPEVIELDSVDGQDEEGGDASALIIEDCEPV